MSPSRFVHVYKIPDGRWSWRLMDEEARLENGPAYPLRREAGLAALNLFPKDPIEVDGE